MNGRREIPMVGKIGQEGRTRAPRGVVLGVIVAYVCLFVLGQSPHSSLRPDSRAASDFAAKINAYLELHKDAAPPVLKPNNSPEKITSTQRRVTSKVRNARSNPKRGDIFTPEIARYFRRQIAASLQGPEGEKITASLRHAEPVKNVPIRVNEPYPPGLPLQSTPPTLLQNLPSLPNELEYRIVGNKLILRDAKANLVVDFVKNAFPPR